MKDEVWLAFSKPEAVDSTIDGGAGDSGKDGLGLD